MGYLHIDNLYKNQDILMFKECFVMEKIHGTSAHVGWKDNRVIYFSGGENHEKFLKLFNHEDLEKRFKELNIEEFVLYGEAYGGKQQGMSDTYGKELKFIVFDVKIGHSWLNVLQAHKFARELLFEFVAYWRSSTLIGELNRWRDFHSTQALRNGIIGIKKMEGIVIRPLIELKKNNGERIIAKHKRDDFRETKTPRTVDKDKLQVLTRATEIADEWVTPMRLNHVLDKIENPDITKMKDIIIAMSEDIKREAEGEIVWSKEVGKAIGRATAIMTKRYFQSKLNG